MSARSPACPRCRTCRPGECRGRPRWRCGRCGGHRPRRRSRGRRACPRRWRGRSRGGRGPRAGSRRPRGTPRATPVTARCRDARSSRSPSAISTGRSARARRSLDGRARTRTVAPARSSSRTTLAPTKPVPPVTSASIASRAAHDDQHVRRTGLRGHHRPTAALAYAERAYGPGDAAQGRGRAAAQGQRAGQRCVAVRHIARAHASRAFVHRRPRCRRGRRGRREWRCRTRRGSRARAGQESRPTRRWWRIPCRRRGRRCPARVEPFAAAVSTTRSTLRSAPAW